MSQAFFDVHHISFDVWLTLIRSNPHFKPGRDLLLKNMFALPQPVAEISATIRQWDQRFTAINEVTGKNMDAEEMITIILAALDCDLKHVTPGMLSDFFEQQEHLFTLYSPLLIEDKLAEHLKRLADQDISLSILSNTGFIKGKLLRALMDHLELSRYFSFQLYSDEISFSKPSSQAFDEVYKQVSALRALEKNNILHIGDNAHADVHGAHSAGMQQALINSNNISLLSLVINKHIQPFFT